MNKQRLQDLTDRCLAIRPAGRRILIAISGPPASGKSRLAASLVDALNARSATAILVPMDGFHLDNVLLQARDLLPRKGAPETFDGAGFVHAVRRLQQEDDIVLPTFDRARDISVAGAVHIGPQHRIAVVEGNYLCFDDAPWRDLQDLWDLSIYLDVPEDVLLERLIRRWIKHNHTAEEAEKRARSNDLPNARRVRNSVGKVDLRITPTD